jgi:hypothetical protein
LVADPGQPGGLVGRSLLHHRALSSAPLRPSADNFSVRFAHADLVEMHEQVGGILVHPVGAGVAQFVDAVAARQSKMNAVLR